MAVDLDVVRAAPLGSSLTARWGGTPLGAGGRGIALVAIFTALAQPRAQAAADDLGSNKASPSPEMAMVTVPAVAVVRSSPPPAPGREALPAPPKVPAATVRPQPPSPVSFSTTSAQLLYGWGFRDQLFGYDASNGRVMTLTVSNYSTWRYGDSFAFVDVYQAEAFVDGSHTKLYGEWHPRLLLNQLFDDRRPLWGLLRTYGLAFEINASAGYAAVLAGVGGDFALPGAAVLGANLYWRRARVDLPSGVALTTDGIQLNGYWTVPVEVGPNSVVATGFVDLVGVAGGGLDLMFQPQLLVDVLGALGGARGRLYTGLEWYLHGYRDPSGGGYRWVSAPQALVHWTIF